MAAATTKAAEATAAVTRTTTISIEATAAAAATSINQQQSIAQFTSPLSSPPPALPLPLWHATKRSTQLLLLCREGKIDLKFINYEHLLPQIEM